MLTLPRAGALVMCALIPAMLMAAGPGLVRNSSFEDAVDVGTVATGWEATSVPPGGIDAVTDAKARTGRFSHEIMVPETAPITWYQVSQAIVGAGQNKTYTLSVYIQTKNVRDGAGAYCSINCFDPAGTRIGVYDADAKVLGTTTQWQRQTVTAKIPERTSKVVVILCLHGYGTAYFDDVQFEEGDVATPYHASAPDEEAARQAKRERAEAAELFKARPLPAGKKGLVAILRDKLPVDGCASSPELLGKWLTGAGYAVAYLDGAQLSNRYVLRGPRGASVGGPPPFNLVVLPYGGTFPETATRAMQSFLRHGGAFISMGGYTFDNLLVDYQGKWMKPSDIPPPKTPVVPVLTFNGPELSKNWGLGSNPGGTLPKLSLVTGRPGAGKALKFSVNPLRAWATATLPVGKLLPPASKTGGLVWAVTRFWAKGDANTTEMAIEWHESDGSRWKCNVPLTTHWKQYTLNVSDFEYWHDNPSVGRGGYGDHLHPENVSVLLIGLAEDIAQRDKPHTFWIDDLGVQTDPQAKLRIAPPCMNTRTAPIRDSMHPTVEQIPVFDPSHMLEFVREAKASAGQFVVPQGTTLPGAIKGYAAVGMLGNNGWGFGPNLIKLEPLLDGIDRFGRFQGPVGSIMDAFAGFYQGASWASFGATNRDLFNDTPAAKTIFVNTVNALVRRLYLHNTGAEMSSYKPGETARLVTTVSNLDWRRGAKDANVVVRMELVAKGQSKPAYSEEKRLTMKPASSEQVSFEWKVPADAADYYAIHATVLEGGKPIDGEDGAVVIWSDRANRPAEPVAKTGPYFSFGGAPRFLVGCQTYWGQNGSYTARSPKAFEHDYTMMQDYGLHFSRLFVPWGDAKEGATQAAQSDAMIQLAQEHRIVFYDAPNLHVTPVKAELAKEETKARALGERYKAVPWMLVDVCNEPSLNLKDEKMVGPFNDWLKAKYGTTEALRKAWGPDAPELGKVKPVSPSGKFGDLRTRDEFLFLRDVEKAWADGNRAAIRSADPTRMVSVGNLQGFGYGDVGYDPPATATGLDFSDRHFYGPPDQQARELKDIDLRLLGEPIIQGECGAKDHPTYAKEDPWGMGDTPEEFDARFTSLVHHAFGIGAAALSSWHWRDPMEGIFPCGLTHADGVPRPAASIMRAMAFTFGRLRPVFRTPEVVLLRPDNHRFGGDRYAVLDAIHRCEDMLMSCQVDFATLGEDELNKLPAGVRAIVYPVPYCPSDATVAALEAFVRKGGALYFSGDISYDPNRKLTRAGRLTELAGVERVGDGKPVGPMPVPEVKAAGAKVLRADAKGRPMVVVNERRGAGEVVYCVEPVEAETTMPDWSRGMYINFLDRARVDRNPVTPKVATLQCFQVPLAGGGRAFVLWNYAKKTTTATVTLAGLGPEAVGLEQVSLEIAPNCPGLIVASAGRTVTAVEAQGAVKRNGRTIATIRGHAIIQSLDGRDIETARQLLILPWPGMYGRAPQPGTPGEVAMASLSRMRVELGELRNTKWTRLEPMKASGGRVTYDEEESRNVILAATPDQFAKAAGAVEALTMAK